jgi:hypothetical protein
MEGLMSHQISVLLSPTDILGMLQHWAATPAGGYLGSDFGGRDIVCASLGGPQSAKAEQVLIGALYRDMPALAGYFQGVRWIAARGSLTFSTFTGEELDLTV